MRLSLAAFATLGALAAGPLARADEPAKARLALRDRWKAGLVVTRTLHEVEGVKVKQGGEQVKDDSTVVDASLVLRCDGADADGRIAKGVVHVAAWSRTDGTEKDASLEGVTIDVLGGAEPSWKARPGSKDLSEAASDWLDKHFGKTATHDKRLAAIEPAEPVAVGGTWTPDVAKVVAAIASQVEVDPEKSKIVGTLETVEGGLATANVKIDLATKAFPNPAGPMPWTEGGMLSMTIRIVRRADGSPVDAKIERKGGLKGVTGGGAVALEFTGETTETTKAGGTIPEPPAEPPPPEAPTKK